MATGYNLPGSIRLSSDQVFDRNCTICEEDNTVSEAVCYCTECCKYYCSPCQTSHNKLLRDHRNSMLDKTAMLKTLPKPPTRAALTTTCEEHGKLVEIYCKDHDVVCCTVCVALHHKKCDHTDFIPEIAQGYAKNPSVKKVRSDLQAVRKEMMVVKSSRKSDQTRINKEKEHVLTQLKDSRRRMNEVFDRLEEAVVREADTRYEEFGESIQADLGKCDEALSRIEKTIQELGNTHSSNEAQLFVHVKQGAERIDAWRELGKQIKQHVGDDTIKFVLDEDIEKYLKNLQKLGEFVNEMRKSSKPRLVDRKEKVVVKMKQDIGKCSVWGLCLLPGGRTLLSDCWNNKLKRLSSSYQVTDSCSIDNPHGLCYVGQSDKVAVCVRGAVKIVSLGSTMSVVRSINMKYINCYGVAYRNNLLYVTEDDGIKLHVLEFDSGRHMTTVDIDRQGHTLFSRTQHVAVNNDGSEIWVADYNKGLVVLDKDYNLLRLVNVDEMDEALAVCFDKENTVFVCCKKPRAVLQLNSEQTGIRRLLQGDDLPGYPSSICYDDNRSCLLVTMFNSDTITLVHLR